MPLRFGVFDCEPLSGASRPDSNFDGPYPWVATKEFWNVHGQLDNMFELGKFRTKADAEKFLRQQRRQDDWQVLHHGLSADLMLNGVSYPEGRVWYRCFVPRLVSCRQAVPRWLLFYRSEFM